MGQNKDRKQRVRRTNAQIALDKKKKEDEAAHARASFFEQKPRKLPRTSVHGEESSSNVDAANAASAHSATGAEARGAEPIAIEIDHGNRTMSGSGVVNDATHVAFISGYEPTAVFADASTPVGSALQGWEILHRSVDDGRPLWRQGSIVGPGSEDDGKCIVSFDDGVQELLPLRLEHFCDGSQVSLAAGCPWFRVVPRAAADRTRRELNKPKLKAMAVRCGRRFQQEVGDGHCGFRGVARQMMLAGGIIVDKVEVKHIKMARITVSTAVSTYIDHVLAFVKSEYESEDEREMTRRQVLRRAETIRNVDCATPCTSAYYYADCDYAADSVALAMHLQTSVYVVDENRTYAYWFLPIGQLKEVPIEEMSPQENDIVLQHEGSIHFDSYVVSNPSRLQHVAAETFDVPVDDEDDSDSDCGIDEELGSAAELREIFDDPIPNVDDAPRKVRQYFDKVVQQIRAAVGRQGNRHQSKLKESGPGSLCGTRLLILRASPLSHPKTTSDNSGLRFLYGCPSSSSGWRIQLESRRANGTAGATASFPTTF